MKKKSVARHLLSVYKHIGMLRKRMDALEQRVDQLDTSNVTTEDLIRVRQHMYFLDVAKSRAVGNAIDDYLNWTRKQ